MLSKLYKNVNPNKLVDELQAQGLLEQEQMSFFPKEDGLEIRFRAIKEIKTDVLVDEEVVDTITSYQKRAFETIIETIDELEVEKQVEVWNKYDITKLFTDIQTVVDNHDPTPLTKPKTELELMQEAIDFLVMGGM